MPKTTKRQQSSQSTKEELWQLAIAEAQGIREQCDRAKLDKIGDQIMRATKGESKADSIIALCTAIIAILPENDLGLRMNAVTVLLQDILKARIEMAPNGHVLH